MQRLAQQWIQATVAIVITGLLVFNAKGASQLANTMATGYSRIIGAFYNVQKKG